MGRREPGPVYHVELRQFPHKHHRFNLGEQQLLQLLIPWAQERVVELGERRWSPQQASITVLEGPELPPSSLSMGRGWRAAEREGADVTKRMLAVAAGAPDASAASAARAGAPAEGARALRAPAGARPNAGDATAGGPPSAEAATHELAARPRLAALLGEDADRLLLLWLEVATHNPRLAPSESLAIAERRAAGGEGA